MLIYYFQADSLQEIEAGRALHQK